VGSCTWSCAVLCLGIWLQSYLQRGHSAHLVVSHGSVIMQSSITMHSSVIFVCYKPMHLQWYSCSHGRRRIKEPIWIVSRQMTHTGWSSLDARWLLSVIVCFGNSVSNWDSSKICFPMGSISTGIGIKPCSIRYCCLFLFRQMCQCINTNIYIVAIWSVICVCIFYLTPRSLLPAKSIQ